MNSHITARSLSHTSDAYAEASDSAIGIAIVCLVGIWLSRILNNGYFDYSFAVIGSITIVIIVGLHYIQGEQVLRLSLIDCALMGLWVAEILELAGSSYRRNSFNSLYDFAVLSTAYGLYRVIAVYWPAVKGSMPVLGVLAGAVGCAQLCFAIPWYRDAMAAGFAEVGVLKAQMPGGIVPLVNDRATVLLLLLPLTVSVVNFATKTKRLQNISVVVACVSCTLVTVALLLTMSRGAYLAAVIFWGVLLLAATLARVRVQQVWIICVSSIVLATVFVIIAVPAMTGELYRMASAHQSVSQGRSVDAHFAIWKAAWRIGSQHVVLGVGPNNFPIQFLPLISESSSATFAGRTFNTPLQVFAERGLIGVGSFAMFFSCILIVTLRSLKADHDEDAKLTYAIVLAASIALFARELTYSSVLISPAVSILVCYLFAVVADQDSRVYPMRVRTLSAIGSRLPSYGAILALVVIAGLTGVFTVKFRYIEAERDAHQAASSWASGEDDQGRKAFLMAEHLDSDNAYLAGFQGLAEGQRALIPDGLLIGNPYPQNLVRERDALLASINSYETASRQNPRDDNFAGNLGWLYLADGDGNLADQYFVKASQISPTEPAYHIGRGVLMDSMQREDIAAIEYSLAVAADPKVLDSCIFRSLFRARPELATAIVDRGIAQLMADRARTASPIVMGRLGELLVKSGHSQDAVPVLTEAVKELPYLAAAWGNLGKAFEVVGRRPESEAAFRKAWFLQGSDLSNRQATGLVDAASDSQAVTEHAARITRLYMTDVLFPDDLLPPHLLAPCESDLP